MKKTQRLRPLETSSSTNNNNNNNNSNRPRESLDPTTAPTASANPATQSAHPSLTDLSKSELVRYGVHVPTAQEKLPTGVSFASDKLAKPRVAKSTTQTEKIATILSGIGVPELIPLPTPGVVEAFERIMAKVQILLDLRKVAEKEEGELGVRRREREVGG